MGREIRKVPPNWEHPKTDRYSDDSYQPMYDRTFATEATEWKAAFAKWEAGERPEHCTGHYRDVEYWEWDQAPPDRSYYRPYSDEEATWFQVYETVSEGTPVTPPFATKEELVDYLATHGDFWDQKRGHGPWDRANAEKFVGVGWAPSLIVTRSATSTEVLAPRDGMPEP